jgi:hypothetical protein
MKIANDVTELIGQTPSMHLQRLTEDCLAEFCKRKEGL